jgi:hypothetical protein
VIRLCCTMQDVTLQQHQTQTRQQLAGLCQWEVSLAWQLSRQWSLPQNNSSTEQEAKKLSSLQSVAVFQQQHCHWLLEFYCQRLGNSAEEAVPSFSVPASPASQFSPLVMHYDSPHQSQQTLTQVKRALLPMLSEMILCYQPVLNARHLQLLWQPIKFSERTQLDSHRFWQLGCGVLQLACTIAATKSSLSVELLPFQTKVTLRLQLQLDGATALQLQQDLLIVTDNEMKAITFVQQRLRAAQFWAAQLDAELTVQQEHQKLILLLLLDPKDHEPF